MGKAARNCKLTLKFEEIVSFKEERWQHYLKETEIFEEARQAWEVGRTLGLIKKCSDDEKRVHLES